MANTRYIITLLLLIGSFFSIQAEEKTQEVASYKQKKAHKYFEQQLFPKALSLYGQLNQEGKLDRDSKKEYAHLLFLVNQFSASISILDSIDSDRSELVNLYAKNYLSLGKYSTLDSLLEHYPGATKDSFLEIDEIRYSDFLSSRNKNKNVIINNVEWNTRNMEISPRKIDSTVYYVSDRTEKLKLSGKNGYNGGAYFDIYAVEEVDKTFSASSFNSLYNDGAFCLNDEKNIAIVTHNAFALNVARVSDQEHNTMQLYKTEKDSKGKWQKPTLLFFCKKEYTYTDPYIINGYLYFTSDMPGGYGQDDIYKVAIDENYTPVGTPENLGETINTNGKEGFTFVSDQNELYFSSNGHPGFGGLDQFKAQKVGEHYKVQNLGRIYNTHFDDFGYTKTENQSGYFVSNREGGKGSDDIYAFTELPVYTHWITAIDKQTQKTLESIPFKAIGFSDKNWVNDTIKSKPYQIDQLEKIKQIRVKIEEQENYLAFKQEITAKNDTFFVELSQKHLLVKGNVYDKITKKPCPKATVTILCGQEIIENIFCGSQGEYECKLEPNKDYTLIAQSLEYFPQKEYLNTANRYGEIIQDFYLSKELEFKGNLYAVNKWEVTDEFAAKLDNMIEIIKEYKNLRIGIYAHTDSRGSKRFNQNLSEKRAYSAYNYLVEGGISPDRLRAKGFGEEKLKNKCADGVQCSDEEHHENRRTTFQIIK